MKIRFLTKRSSLTAISTISFGRAYESRIFTLHFPSAKEKEGKKPLALKENANLRLLWERLFLIIVRFFNLTPISLQPCSGMAFPSTMRCERSPCAILINCNRNTSQKPTAAAPSASLRLAQQTRQTLYDI
ncbi:hypothetical protein I7I48_05052 [Histoplasma ohiense]|nr:hypothetical protein I7I48_05052 [Histoplasma ohiense (nom. inval.)]